MALLIGTDEGLYRVDQLPFEREEAELVLDCGWVTGVKMFEHTAGIFVASETGAYRSTDGAQTWDDLGISSSDRYWHSGESEVWSVHATRDGVWYVGTNDPFLFRSTDDGETWSEVKGFRDIPSRGHWESPHSPHRARLRTLESPPGQPDHLVAGIEAGGYHVSEDGGQTWHDHRDTLMDDIHQILPLSEDVWLAATGYLDNKLQPHNLTENMGHAIGLGGLYRTTDAGESWVRLDTDNRFAYIRKMFAHDGRLYFCGAVEKPTEWIEDDHETALFESTNLGRTFDRVSYPGESDEYIDAWTVHEGDVLSGSGLLVDVPDYRSKVDVDGRIMRRNDGVYETVGYLPSNVSALESI